MSLFSRFDRSRREASRGHEFRTPRRPWARARLTSAALVLSGVVLTPSAAHALPDTSSPQLVFNRLIRTSPFVGSTTSVRDNEGSAFVARDNALWMVEDNGKAAYEIDATTGSLRRKIDAGAFAAAPRLGVGTAAGSSRVGDLEAMAYDANADALFAFSGSTSSTPTVFRLTRDGSRRFQVESWQPLSSEYTAAGWRLADGRLYVANDSTIRTLDYAANSLGSTFSVSGLSRILGIDFDDGTGDLVAVDGSQQLVRASMATRTILPGWKLDLRGFGIRDSRAVEVVGEQIFVSDGLDTRASNDPMNHAIFVLDVGPRRVTVHLSTPEQTRLTQLLGVYGSPNAEALLKYGVQVLAFLNALDPQPNPTPVVLGPPGTAGTRTVVWNANEVNTLDTVRARWLLNDEDAHRFGFDVLSFFAALNGT